MTPTALHRLDALQAAALPARRELRAVDLPRACLDRVAERLCLLMDEGLAISGERHAADLAHAAAARCSVDALFDRFDVLLAPSTAGEAPIGIDATGDPRFCRGWTLLGLPCVHLPSTRGRQGLPVGLQLVGRRGEDHRLLAARNGFTKG
jgi:Asp-tRNA(Asn)/Glu-tRNA(Gln) amidotransferase A subunit family amidase